MITINLMEVLIVILGIAGFVVLVSFAALLISLLKVVKEARGLIEDKKTQIDQVINEMPNLVNNVNTISLKASMLVDDVNEIVIRSKDDFTGFVHSINTTMDDVNRVSAMATNLAAKVEYAADNVEHQVHSLADNLLDVTSFLSYNKDNLVDYVYIFRDFFDEMRRILFGRR